LTQGHQLNSEAACASIPPHAARPPSGLSHRPSSTGTTPTPGPSRASDIRCGGGRAPAACRYGTCSYQLQACNIRRYPWLRYASNSHSSSTPVATCDGQLRPISWPNAQVFWKNGDHEWARFCKRDVVNRKSAQHSASNYCVDEFPLPMHGPHLGPVSGSDTQVRATYCPFRAVRRLVLTHTRAAAISFL
jgi:hypothetical protein